MKFGNALFARFARLARLGLFAQKAAGPDPFDLHLQRISRRERIRKNAPVLFRNQPSPLAV